MEQEYAVGKASRHPSNQEADEKSKPKRKNRNKNAKAKQVQQGNRGTEVRTDSSANRLTEFFSKLSVGKETSASTSATVSVTFGGDPRRNSKGEIDEKTLIDYLSDISQLDLRDCPCTFDIVGSECVASVICQTSKVAETLISTINEGTEYTMVRAIAKTHDEVKMQEILKGFMERCDKPFHRHEEKIKECRDQICGLGRGRNGQFIPLEEWNRREFLCQPLESKLEELSGQQNEFESFIVTLTEKLEQMSGEANFDRKTVAVRKEFALELARYENCLPIYARKSDVIEVVEVNQVSVILGETGSGKSTQMLQYMHEAGLHESGLIVCTQPRKVAAISLAQRVAQEMGTAVGELVGYQVGMQARKGPATRLLYVTDHVLLNECLKDRTFRPFSCIIIDEAHERSIYTDLLLGLIKRILPQRPDLKVVITSATINPEVFVRFFATKSEPIVEPTVLKVSGRMFPVDVIYEQFENEDYVGAAWQKAFEIHRGVPQGDILVFLTSPLETERAKHCLKHAVDNKAIVLELHGRLQVADQQKVFEPTPPGHRKIVFATNSAETSITIPGIKFVVDCGKVREMTYDASRNMSALIVTWTTKSSAEQRKGRAGRTAAGCCYRLYTDQQYESMRPESVPEILRVHVGQALLKLMSLGIADPTDFDFVEPPSAQAIDSALEVLRDLEAYDDNGITEVGKKLAKLSLEPRLGKVALLGVDRHVAYESLIMAAVMSVGGSVFFRAGSDEQKQEADRRKTKFADEWGDIVTLANVYRGWEKVPEKQRNSWCVTNSINAKSMRLAKDVLRDTMQAFSQDIGVTISAKQSEREDLNRILAKIIFDCYGSNLSRYSGHKMAGYLIAKTPTTSLNVHPSSALNYIEELPKWVVYEQVLTTAKTYLLNATPVDAAWINEALSNGKRTFSMSSLREYILTKFTLRGVGKTCFQRLRANRAAELKRLEEEIKSTALIKCDVENCSVIIDINTEVGAIHLFSQPAGRDISNELVNNFWQKIREDHRNEIMDKPIVSEEPSVRMLLARGANVRAILMPNETRQIRITGAAEEVDVEELLTKYAAIEKVDRTASGTGIWGYVTFSDTSTATKLLNDPSLFDSFKMEAVKPPTRTADANNSGAFTVKVTAVRRPLRGYGFITFGSIDEMYTTSIEACELDVEKRFGPRYYDYCVSVDVSKKNNDQLFVDGIPEWADESVILKAIQKRFPDAGGFTFSLPRVKLSGESENKVLERSFKEKVDEILLQSSRNRAMVAHRERTHQSRALEECDFTKNLLTGQTKHFTMVMFLNFNDAEKAQEAVKLLSGKYFNKGVLEATLNLQAKYFVSKYVHSLITDMISEEMQRLNLKPGLTVNIKPAKYGNWNVIVEAADVVELATAKANLSGLLEGQQVIVTAQELTRFYHPSGAAELRQIGQTTGAKCRIDHKRSALFIHGKKEAIAAARTRVEQFIQEARRAPQREISLRSGELAAIGLMKSLVGEFGTNLEGLHDVIVASRIELVLRQQSIHIQCTDEEYTKLLDIIRDKARDLPPVKRSDLTTPDCPVCLTSVELASCYITEYCGHYYCLDCAKNLVQNAITNNTIPIQCASEGCEEPLVLQDLRNLGVDMDKLCETALRVFMNANTKSYCHCVTTDCPMIYRKWTEADEAISESIRLKMAKNLNWMATKFTCGLCRMALCTKCEVPYHVGMSCELFSHCKDKGENLKEVREWVEVNPENRGFCPNCFVAIEKNGGCLHMHCTKCQTHMCWGCRQSFPDAASTYRHMRTTCERDQME